MLFENSVWYPNSVRSIAIIILLVGMTLLHFTEVIGLTNAGLLLGWLPVQLAYDMTYTVLSVILLYGVYRISPAVSAEYKPTTAEPDERSTADASGTTGTDSERDG